MRPRIEKKSPAQRSIEIINKVCGVLGRIMLGAMTLWRCITKGDKPIRPLHRPDKDSDER